MISVQEHASALRLGCAAALALALCWPTSAAAAADCELWGSSQFFRDVTPSAVQECLSVGAEPNARQERVDYPVRWKPLHFAASHNTPAMIAALIEAGADWQIKTSEGNEPLFLAVALKDIPDAASPLESAGASLGRFEKVRAKIMGLITKVEQLAFPPDETGVAFGGPLPAGPDSLPSQ